jgi:trimethylamine:corrinoid methyltransferase-like protein
VKKSISPAWRSCSASALTFTTKRRARSWYGGGAKIDGVRVRIPEYMVTRALATTPKRLTLYDRNGKVAIRAGGYNSYYGGGSDCLNILDHRTGQRRKDLY